MVPLSEILVKSGFPGRSRGTRLTTPMPHDLPKAYDPTAIEDHWAEYWVREKLFAQPTPDRTPRTKARTSHSFTILLPPPNVTGNLHMGHMFEHTESDILIRWHRMCGESCALDSRHGPCRHRDADAGGAADYEPKARPGSRWAARSLSSAFGNGDGIMAARFWGR